MKYSDKLITKIAEVYNGQAIDKYSIASGSYDDEKVNLYAKEGKQYLGELLSDACACGKCVEISFIFEAIKNNSPDQALKEIYEKALKVMENDEDPQFGVKAAYIAETYGLNKHDLNAALTLIQKRAKIEEEKELLFEMWCKEYDAYLAEQNQKQK